MANGSGRSFAGSVKVVLKLTPCPFVSNCTFYIVNRCRFAVRTERHYGLFSYPEYIRFIFTVDLNTNDVNPLWFSETQLFSPYFVIERESSLTRGEQIRTVCVFLFRFSMRLPVLRPRDETKIQ